jgi:hypothetical protein
LRRVVSDPQLTDVIDADFHHVRADKAAGAPTFVLDAVQEMTVSDSRPVGDTHVDQADHKEL